MMSKLSAISVCALLVLASPASEAEDKALGRLFFTPQQRAALDAGRRIAQTKKAPDKPTTAARGPRELELTGIVTRSDGERTVWINGKAYYDASPRGTRIKTDPRKPGSAQVHVFSQGTATEVRVGQRLDVRSGRISDKLTAAPPRPTTTAASGVPAERALQTGPQAESESAATVGSEEKD